MEIFIWTYELIFKSEKSYLNLKMNIWIFKTIDWVKMDM